MPRISSQYVIKPILQHRYMVHTSKLPGIQLYGRSAQMPQVENNPVQIDHKGGYIRVKGRSIWNDITIQCYLFEAITINSLWSYFNKHHSTVDGTDKFLDNYKHDMQLWVLSPQQIPLGRWRLIDSFISGISWGDMSWDSDQIIEATLTVTYDYAIYEGI